MRALSLSCSAWARGQGWPGFSHGSTSSKHGASTACLDSPSQAWTSFLGKILFLIFQLGVSKQLFYSPCTLVLLSGTAASPPARNTPPRSCGLLVGSCSIPSRPSPALLSPITSMALLCILSLKPGEQQLPVFKDRKNLKRKETALSLQQAPAA